jgi:Cu-Zn family superoxide dismutase
MTLAFGGCRIRLAAVVLVAVWEGWGWSVSAQYPQGSGKPLAPSLLPQGRSALKELRGDFEKMTDTWPQWKRPGSKQEDELFEDFLAWPRNPRSVELTVRLTFPGGVGPAIGSLTVKNGEIMVAGRKEVGLLIQPDVRGLPQGRYAFHVHEKADCASALKDGQHVPGLAAGDHLWASGTGDLEGTTFTSHLGDLPDLEVGADGNAKTLIVAARLTLADVAGRSLMIHASQDDNSERLACAAFD